MGQQYLSHGIPFKFVRLLAHVRLIGSVTGRFYIGDLSFIFVTGQLCSVCN